MGIRKGGLPAAAGLQTMVGGAPAAVAPAGVSDKAKGDLLLAEVKGCMVGVLSRGLEDVNWPGRRSRSLWGAVRWAVWHQCPSLPFAPTGLHCRACDSLRAPVRSRPSPAGIRDGTGNASWLVQVDGRG